MGATGEDSNQITITNGTTANADNSNSASGGAYVYKRSGTSWAQEAYIKASNNDASDSFGASISIDVDTIAVGATGEDSGTIAIINGMTSSSNDNSSASGAAYVYKRYGNFWIQEAYIKAANANGDNDSNFGHSVSIDGDTLAVSAINEDSVTRAIINGTTAGDDDNSSNSGAVYVYKRTGQTWAQEAYIKAANSDNDSNFGFSVSLDGNTIVVGAPYEDSNQATITNGTSALDNNSNSNSGAVYVYKRTGSNWAQEAYIKAANSDNDSKFGFSVSLDGDTIVVGAPYEDSDLTTITNGTTANDNVTSADSGAVYVYKRTGSNWAQEAYIKASNNSAADLFGYSVSIDNDTLVVGAYLESSDQRTITNGTTAASTDNSMAGTGAVYVYKRSGSTWTQQAYIKAVNSNVSDNFGRSVSINNDTLVVGANLEDSSQTTVTNGTTAASDNDKSASGAVYVFTRNGSEIWTQDAYIKASNNDVDDNFGEVVSIDGDTIALGVQLEDSSQTTITNGATASTNNDNSSSGAVYVYK